jgi:hypothetical protein
MNSKESSTFFGGKAAASPLAYYYHLKKYGKVILGGGMKVQGLGPYKKDVKSFFNKKGIVEFPIKFDNENISLLDIGYIYQNKDPLFSYVENGLYWQIKIDKFVRRECFTEEEKEKYYLNSYKIGLKESNYWMERDKEKMGEWKILISDMKMIKDPINPENELSSLFYTYKKSHGNDRTPFYKEDGNRYHMYQNSFVFSNNGWDEIDKTIGYHSDGEMKSSSVIDMQIKHSHIHESLVHEMLKIMLAWKGWYVNFEVPIKGKKDSGRIDFLIKKDLGDKWKLIEVKLRDNPNAVNQLCNYIEMINLNVNKTKDDSIHFKVLWNGKNMKDLQGIVLCGHPASDITIDKSHEKGFEVWTYQFYKYTIGSIEEPQLGIKVMDENNNVILKTH